MRFGNTSPKHLLVALGLLTAPASTHLDRFAAAEALPPKPAAPDKLTPVPNPDPRTLRLSRFFSRLHCPVVDLASDFVRAADENHLDWRLLPSISVIESGGGKAYRNNNIFGWNNGLQLFPSIRHGIREVAFKLGRSPLYRNRDTVGKLRAYNNDDGYVQNVIAVMNRISPVVNLRQSSAAFAYQQN